MWTFVDDMWSDEIDVALPPEGDMVPSITLKDDGTVELCNFLCSTKEIMGDGWLLLHREFGSEDGSDR